MKKHVLDRMVTNAHHNYKIPKDIAYKILKDHNFNDLQSTINGAIKSYMSVYKTDILFISLSKRILGALKEHFTRLLLDRFILNWLTQNRIDLSKIDGELRNGIIKCIQEQKENNA